jgi:nucleoside-diphosphate-sugar epimerase
VLGASGFVGTHVRRRLAGWPAGVTLVGRRALAPGAGESIVMGNLTQPDQLASRLPAHAVVINLAYDARSGHDANLALADGIVGLCRAIHAARLVHVSTAMVVGVVDRFPVTELTTCAPRTPYQQTKLDVEQRLRDGLGASHPVTVLRPTAVFGEGGLNLRKLASDLTTRSAVENYLRASLFGTRPMNLVPVETVAAAVQFAAVSPAADQSQTWLVADDEAPENRFREVERVMREALGIAPASIPPVPVPAALLATVLRVTGRLSFDPRTVFSSDRLIAAGFQRPVTFADALRTYARHLRAEVPEAGKR